MRRKGFTLIELLTVITIIGILSTVATVNYTSARAKARDGKRLGDLEVLRKGLELYVNDFGGYPADGVPGDGGIILGEDGGTMLIDEGWADHNSPVYIERVPPNPGPYGAPYVYRSLNADGSPCDRTPCAAYSLEFYLETDIAGIEAGPYTQSPEGVKPAPPVVAESILSRVTLAPGLAAANRFRPVVEAVDAARSVTIDNPTVEAAAQTVVAPVSTAAVVATTATAITVSQVGAYLYLVFTQPFLLLRKRREFSWGIAYNSQTKLPVDLAIVRLIEEGTKRLVQTRVTDRQGRLFFFAPAGSYRIEVTKPGFAFPATTLGRAKEDGSYGNLYYGGRIVVGTDGAAVNPSIPLDPAGVEVSDADAVKRFLRGKWKHGVALSGFFLTLGSFIAKPGVFLGALMAVHVILYVLMRRLAYPRQPAQWGVVADERDGNPIAHAVIRLFTLPYHKLVETRVADRHGRYNFMVGKNLYYVTATHPGYWKTESFPLDLRGTDRPQVIAAPVNLRPLSEPAEVDGRPSA